jgi:L-threonylcarbamoyladenylate synthase
VSPAPIAAAHGDPPPEAAISAAVDALVTGEIVGLPTDTVYGLAADPFQPAAVDRIFAAKGRPRAVELPLLVAGADQLDRLAERVPDAALRVMARFWPGGLTVILPRRPDLTVELGENRATIGVRCPAHPVPLAVCARLGPIATTSANRHGEPPFGTAGEVAAAFAGAVRVVLDAGAGAGEPSTVVDFSGPAPRLLRAGALPWDLILAAVDSEP